MCGSAQNYEILGKILQNMKECTALTIWSLSVSKKVLPVSLRLNTSGLYYPDTIGQNCNFVYYNI